MGEPLIADEIEKLIQRWTEPRRSTGSRMTSLNMFLLIAALLLLLIWLTPPAADCFIPPNAPTRGFYAECWTLEELIR